MSICTNTSLLFADPVRGQKKSLAAILGEGNDCAAREACRPNLGGRDQGVQISYEPAEGTGGSGGCQSVAIRYDHPDFPEVPAHRTFYNFLRNTPQAARNNAPQSHPSRRNSRNQKTALPQRSRRSLSNPPVAHCRRSQPAGDCASINDPSLAGKLPQRLDPGRSLCRNVAQRSKACSAVRRGERSE